MDVQNFQLLLQIIHNIFNELEPKIVNVNILKAENKDQIIIVNNLIQCLFFIEVIIWKHKSLKNNKQTDDLLISVLMKYMDFFRELQILLATWPKIDIFDHNYILSALNG